MGGGTQEWRTKGSWDRGTSKSEGMKGVEDKGGREQEGHGDKWVGGIKGLGEKGGREVGIRRHG